MKHVMRTLTGSLLISLAPLAPLAAAKEEHDPAAVKVASGFLNLTGSEENALALVRALREGVSVRLAYPAATPSGTPEVIVIDPPSGKMTWNDVTMALMLARDALRRYGIVRPTGEQLQAALTGGDAPSPNGKVVTFRGVLQMRAEGMNWGKIAAERFRRSSVTSRLRSPPSIPSTAAQPSQ
jgi:hypothetical protein